MPSMTPTETTWETGGTTKAADMTFVLPDRVHTDADFKDLVPGMNGPFIADVLSQMLMHEQCGVHLYRSCATRTHNPMLQRTFEEFGEETELHVTVLQELITAMGGDPSYVSPAARATEKLNMGTLEATFILNGSIDLMTQELMMVEAVMHAETTDRANWQTLAKMAEQLPEGAQREAAQAAVGRVLPQEDEHWGWAAQMRERMILLQGSSSFMASLGEKAERVVDKIKTMLD